MKIQLLLVIALSSQPTNTRHVRIGVFSIFRPAAVELSSTSGRKLQVDGVAEDGRRRKYRLQKLSLNCNGKQPVCFQDRGRRVCAAKFEIGPAAGDECITAGVPGKISRDYSGSFEVSRKGPVCLVVNRVSLNEYANSVACHEIRGAGEEALKAQLVASRTYALAGIDKHAGEEIEFCDLTHCQVYTGREACTSKQRETLEEVQGLVLLYEGKPAETYYFSTCAGHTFAAEDAWGPKNARDYLLGIRDGKKAYCSGSPHLRWRFQADCKDVCSRLSGEFEELGMSANGHCGCHIEISERAAGGWVKKLKVVGEKMRVVRGESFRMLMGRWYGWGEFKSANFRLEKRGEHLVFHGRGLGHGVGMCQYGAIGMAEKGFDFREILSHYYPGTVLGEW